MDDSEKIKELERKVERLESDLKNLKRALITFPKYGEQIQKNLWT